jgi:ribokinase
LRDLGVDLGGLLKVEDEPTGVALIVVDARGENQIAVASGANSRLTGMAVERLLSGLIETTDCVLVSTEIGAEAVNAAVRMACDAGVRCVLNPAPPQPGILESISRGAILTPNRSELASLVKMLDLEATFPSKAADGVDQLHDLASRLSHVSGAPVVVTLGAEGALLMRPDASHVTFAAIQTVVRDTTGAGDTFNGALAAALAGGASMSSAIKAATAAASRSVSDSGARTRQDHPTS